MAPLAVTIPVYVSVESHRVLLEQTLRSIRTKHEFILVAVLNRHPAGFEIPVQLTPNRGILLPGKEPQSVASAWNLGLAAAKEHGCEYVIILNQDVVLKSTAIDLLVEFAKSHEECTLWGMSPSPSIENLEQMRSIETQNNSDLFSAFMVRNSFCDEMGTFDENFIPAYWEDQDMIVRLVLGGKKFLRCPESLFFHHGSATIQADPVLSEENKVTFLKNARYFMDKWGWGAVADHAKMHEEYFKHPYNEKDKPLSYWRRKDDPKGIIKGSHPRSR